jgi:hypothetical protein
MSDKIMGVLLSCLVMTAATAEEPPREPPAEAPRVYTQQQAFLKAAEIEHTSDFENIEHPHLEHPFRFEGIQYATWRNDVIGDAIGHIISLRYPEFGRGLQNNSFPDLTLTFGKGGMVTAIGFHLAPRHESAGVWEITLTTPAGKKYVESFAHKAERKAHYRGFLCPEGIVSVRISRPKGRWSPNHSIDNISRSAIVPAKMSPEVATKVLGVPGPLETTAHRRGGRTDAPLEAAVATLWEAAAVGTDPRYVQLLRGDDRDHAVAPLDMRRLLVYWPGEKRMRDWPQTLRLACRDAGVLLWWQGEVATALPQDQARQRFHDALESLDYGKLANRDDVTAVTKRLGMTVQDLDRWAHTADCSVFTRDAGDSELVVQWETSDYTGGSTYRCGVRFRWFVVGHYPHESPTLGDVLAVMTESFQAPYLDRGFFVLLKREIVTASSAGHGLSISFRDDVYKPLVKAIEANGFEYQRQREPTHDGAIQHTWCREADVTFAHVTTSPHAPRTRFHCQPPQRDGASTE